MDNPVFILGAHKSGTSLLRSLFDGHPDLYVVPFGTHIFNLLDFPISNPYFENYKVGSEINTENFINHIKSINQSNDQYSDSINLNRFDLNVFNSNFVSKHDTKNIIINYLESIQKSDLLVDFSSNKRIIEKSVTHHEYALELSLLFPNAKFIHLIRNPYANWVALRKYKSISKGGPLLYRVAKTFQNNYYYLERNKRTIKNYQVLKYEDLLSETESTIKSICSFLDLAFEPTLLSPTKNGEVWSGNSTSDTKFNSVSTKNIDKWKSSVQPIDIYYVNRLFSSFLKSYSYDSLPTPKGFYKKLPEEGFAKYIMNRFYSFYTKDYNIGKA